MRLVSIAFVALLASSSIGLAAPSKTMAGDDGGLGRGINFGNTLEAPTEGAWGFRIEERYFDDVKQAGFATIRLPVKWSAHAQDQPPYRIDETFFERVDWVVENALERELNVVLNMHHYDEFYNDPSGHEARFLALWKQIAARYADQPERLVFELLNEPRDPLTADLWNSIAAKSLAVVRETNADRTVIIGPGQWNSIDGLSKLKLPADDHLIVTVHYYSPFQFTHQGASWAEGADAWLGTKWGSDDDKAAVRRDLENAAAWAKQHKRPLFLGEFGAYSKADMESRARWTTFVRSEAERLGMSWAYWEFGSGFGAFDPQTNQWREPLKQALLGAP
ncbi:MAG: glycoside hydrolase family 5 protein [Planctomycetaceae bacterium]